MSMCGSDKNLLSINGATLDMRAYSLAQKLFSKDTEMNLDILLDSVQSLYFEIKQSNLKSNGYEYFCKTIERAIDVIQDSRVNIDDFLQLRLLGQGGFGKVALVRHKTTNQVYAMKIMNKSLLLRSNQSAFFLEERQIMALSDSPWLVKLHYAFMDRDDIYMVMDFMQGGDMINLMSSYDMPLDWVQFYAAESCIALNSLHDYGFIHLDVKPDNMLLDKNGHLKLCDFGTCVNVQKSNGYFTCNFAVGTPDYISPEMLSSHNKPTKINKTTDWWSWGVFLYELLFEETPFSSDSLVGTYTKIANFESSLKFPGKTSALKPACNLIASLLVAADARPDFERIKNDDFFKHTKWTFDNIKNSVPPYIPEIQDEEDTSNFDVSESAVVSNNTLASKQTSFSGVGGDHLNFVGFSYNPSFHGLNLNRSQSSTATSTSNIRKSNTEDVIEIELNEFKEKLATYQKLLCDIETQNKTLTQNKNSLNIQLQNVTLQLKQESDKNNELKLKLQEQLTKDDDHNHKINEYLSKISHLTAEIDNEKEKCQRLEQEQLQFQLKYSDYEHSSMTLRKNYGGVEKQLKEIKDKYEKSLGEIDRLTSQLSLEKQRNDCLKSVAKGIDDNLSASLTNTPRLSLADELNTPAVKNRAAFLMNSAGPRDDDPNSDLLMDRAYMKTELQNLKEIIKQNTENECKIKNDLRLITNENERLKQQLQNTLDSIKNNPEFVELERKCNSYESCMNLYKKQIKEMTSRLEILKKESVELNSKLEQEMSKNQELCTQINTLKNEHSNEMKKNKELTEKMELDGRGHSFELSELKSEYETTLYELDTTRKNLFISENKVIDLTKKIADFSNNQINSKANVDYNKENAEDDNLKWKNLYLAEKVKKDQAIKKLDEMAHLVTQKGKIRKKSPNAASANTDTKITKKLQMELRNEKIRYEKLLLEKQTTLFEYNELITQLKDKIKHLKESKSQLKSVIQSAGLKLRNSVLSSTVNPIMNRFLAQSAANTDIAVEKPSISDSLNEITSDMCGDTDPFYSTQSTAEDTFVSALQRLPSLAKPSVNFEGFLHLIPHNKMKRTSRKISWKKYYAIITPSHFFIYTEKVEKESLKKLFKKISVGHIQKAFQVSFNEFRKADPKDIPKIFCLKYYDEDLAGVTVGLTNNSYNNLEEKKNTSSFDLNDSSEVVKEFRGHKLVFSDVDNQPFCGSCSMNLGKNMNGAKLLQCYECKLCKLKFHTYHMHLDDECVIPCIKIASKAVQHSNMNNNFIIDMFLMAQSSEEQARWIYALNNFSKISKAGLPLKIKPSIDSDSFIDKPLGPKSSKLEKKSSLLSKMTSSSKGKGSSTS